MSESQDVTDGRDDPLAPRSPDLPDRAARWQSRMLPWMVGMLVVLTAFFFVASFAQLTYLNQKIWDAPRLNSADLSVTGQGGIVDEVSRLEVLARLEANTVERRYHQANVLLMSRVWARYLGFVTGMILALVGAMFVLGKLREDATSLDTSHGGITVALRSSSPGLILAVLGVVLMTTTIITHEEISTRDGSIYIQLSQPPPDWPTVVDPDES